MKLRRSRFLLATGLISVLSLWLAACTSSGIRWNPDDYTVKSGDTVYSIAWRYEVDPEDLAAWNKLNAASVIRPGQRLHTRKPPGYVAPSRASKGAQVAYAPPPPAKRSSSSTSGRSTKPYSARKTSSSQKWVKVRKGDSLSKISARSGVSVTRLAQLNRLKRPYVIQPGQTIYLRPIKTAKVPKRPTSKNTGKKTRKSSTVASTQKKTTAQSYSWPKTIRWKRPAKGKVVKKFNRKRNDAKGIDIKGKVGDPIMASANGNVVYSGNGLVSYGNLIIIKHNKSFLSAYAYNRRLLVKEGDTVKAGQRIAEMGYKDARSPRLHFEIRKNGKPVDPLRYLPW